MLDLGRDHPSGTSAILVLTRAQTPMRTGHLIKDKYILDRIIELPFQIDPSLNLILI